MTLKSVYVYGFGKLVDRYFSFSEGLNIVKTGDAAGTADLFAFIKALLCGFGEEPEHPENVDAGKAGELPLRSKARTAPERRAFPTPRCCPWPRCWAASPDSSRAGSSG